MADIAEKEQQLAQQAETLKQRLKQQTEQHDQELARLSEGIQELRKACTKLEEQNLNLAVVGKSSSDHFVRSVEWEITEFAAKTRDLVNGDSMWSPKFKAAGLDGVQLEFFPKGRCETSSDDSKQPVPDGFCSLFLWCPSGSKLRYQMRVGKFLHAPDDDTYNGRIGHGHTMFCPLAPEVENDAVVIGVDFLEVDRDDEDREGSIRLVSTPVEAMIAREVEVVKNREIKKVVWRIKDFSQKLEQFPRGVSMWSPLFTAGGVKEILLEFYPNGSSNTQKEGFCAFYIRCPDGVEMIVTLFVGSKKKGPIKTKFDSLTGKGLPDFCLVSDEVGTDDTLEVGIEITMNTNTTLHIAS